jgi:hypothetical protein
MQEMFNPKKMIRYNRPEKFLFQQIIKVCITSSWQYAESKKGLEGAASSRLPLEQFTFIMVTMTHKKDDKT